MPFVKVLKHFRRRGEVVEPGEHINIPDDMIPQLVGFVEVTTPRHRSDPWRPRPKAWIQDGELRTQGVFENLAEEIIKLTGHDMELQRRLLNEHCGIFDKEDLSSGKQKQGG